jgi:Flp pilus assembly protein TadG
MNRRYGFLNVSVAADEERVVFGAQAKNITVLHSAFPPDGGAQAALAGSKLRRRLSALVKSLRADRRGNVTVMGALIIPAALAAGGAAVDYVRAGNVRTTLQTALDAAVLAGISASDIVSEQIATANDVFKSNIQKFSSNSATEVNATFSVSGVILSGEATASMQNSFGSLLGLATVAPKASAAAKKSEIAICVLGLNGLDNGAFDVNGGPIFNAPDCAVQANSNSRSGMSQEGKSATVKAKKFGVKGGHKTDSYDPAPTDGSPVIPDPYASMPFPAYSACPKGSKTLDIKDDTVLSPGTYCGGIHINGSGPRVTMQPGVYVMVDGPFWVNGGGIVKGDKVMVAFTGKGSTLQVWGDASVNLTSPTSGTYTNMQFMQDNSDINTHELWVSIGGNGGGATSNAKLSYDGVAYFPTQNFWTFGNATLNANSPGLVIVADKIWTQGNATVNITHNNGRNLPVNAAPSMTFGAVLIK